MADDYIGRKMEALRQGKLGVKQAVSRRGVIQVVFPPKRVMVMRNAGKWADAIVTAFRTAGCLVELLDVTDVDSLLQKWGGADIIVGSGRELAEVVGRACCEDRGQVSVISIGAADAGSDCGIGRMNCVLPADGADARCIARVCVFLSEPGVAGVNGALIPVDK